MKERMATVAIVVLFLAATGTPVRVSALTRATTQSASPIDFQDPMRSPDGLFVIRTLEQAKVQLALARLALFENRSNDTRDVALKAEELWTSVEDRLTDIAELLGMRTPVELDDAGRATLYRLQRLNAQDFGTAYERIVVRNCTVALQRMERMDPRVDSHVPFFKLMTCFRDLKRCSRTSTILLSVSPHSHPSRRATRSMPDQTGNPALPQLLVGAHVGGLSDSLSPRIARKGGLRGESGLSRITFGLARPRVPAGN